jgi:hypothetical protein
MTTAQLRNAALTAEKACNWASAADLWDMALEAYPSRGAMAELDKAKMTARRDACRWSAK